MHISKYIQIFCIFNHVDYFSFLCLLNVNRDNFASTNEKIKKKNMDEIGSSVFNSCDNCLC